MSARSATPTRSTPPVSGSRSERSNSHKGLIGSGWNAPGPSRLLATHGAAFSDPWRSNGSARHALDHRLARAGDSPLWAGLGLDRAGASMTDQVEGPSLEATGERLIPQFQHGEVVHAEHLARYLVAVQLRRVAARARRRLRRGLRDRSPRGSGSDALRWESTSMSGPSPMRARAIPRRSSCRRMSAGSPSRTVRSTSWSPSRRSSMSPIRRRCSTSSGACWLTTGCC